MSVFECLVRNMNRILLKVIFRALAVLLLFLLYKGADPGPGAVLPAGTYESVTVCGSASGEPRDSAVVTPPAGPPSTHLRHI